MGEGGEKTEKKKQPRVRRNYFTRSCNIYIASGDREEEEIEVLGERAGHESRDEGDAPPLIVRGANAASI